MESFEELGLTCAANKICAEVGLISNFRESFSELQKNLKVVHSYLTYADRNGGGQESSRQELVRDLESAALEAQDVIDLCVVKGLDPTASSPCPCPWDPCFNDLLVPCFGRLQSILATYEIAVQIKEMNTIFDELKGRAESLTAWSKVIPITNSILSIKSSEVIYREDTAVDIIPKRQHIEGLIDQHRVVAVVGMGGSGKTYLLQHVFKSIKSRYEVAIWLGVSRTFTVKQLQLNVLAKLRELEAFEVGRFEPQGESEEILQGPIYDALKDWKYLIVFDDVWELQGNEQVCPTNVMEILRSVGLPMHDLRTVLISTRNYDVASQMNAYVYNMPLLSCKHSKELFFKHLLPHSPVEQLQLDGNVEAKAAIDTALKRCGNLPLAIITVAELLKHQNPDEWAKSVQCFPSSSSSTRSQKNVLTTSLMLSFNDLDYSIKPCFIMLGLFAKDENIDAKNLIGMWLANSHVKSQKEGMDVLKHLFNRCLLEMKTYAGSVETVITIHNLVHDLAVKLCREYGGICEVSHYREDKWQELWSRNKRILRISLSKISCIPNTVTFPRSLRVLRLNQNGLNQNELNQNEKLSEIPLKSLAPAVALRTLDIRGTNIASLPECIGNFLLLKYLDIRGCPIKRFPECLRNLKLLEYLYTSIRDEVPQWIGHLEQLAFFEAESAQWTKIDSIPKCLKCLKGVCIHVGSHDDNNNNEGDSRRQEEGSRRRRLWIGDSLSQLTQLEILDRLEIYEFKKGCIPPPNIVHLTLHRGHHHDGPLILPNEWQCCLPRLQYLTLTGIRFPDELHDGFQNLSWLCLCQSGVYSKVISYLPELQTLRLIEDGTCKYLPEEYGRSEAFPKLRTLFISRFQKLKKMPKIEHGGMACLSELDISHCPELSEGCGWTRKVSTLSRATLNRLSLNSINGEFKAQLEAAYNSGNVTEEVNNHATQ